MTEMVQANWPLFAIALIIGLLVAWWIFVALRRTKVETDKSDVLDEGKGPAARNQALIDSPPASATPIAQPLNVDKAEEPRAKIEVEPAPEPVIQPKPVIQTAPLSSSGDDLTRIKGVGPKLRTLLNELGVERFDQIAKWSEDDISRIDAQLGRFEGRIRRDSWTQQAEFLAQNDIAGYESKFGKL